MNHTQYKLLIVGDGGVGKTSYVTKLRTQRFTKEYIPTLGVDVHPIHFPALYPNIIFNVWDVAGQKKFGGLKDGYYIAADAAMVMFDTTSVLSFRNVSRWIKNIRFICPTIPIIVCGNKCDIHIQPSKFPSSPNYMLMSTKNNINLINPLTYLVRNINKSNL